MDDELDPELEDEEDEGTPLEETIGSTIKGIGKLLDAAEGKPPIAQVYALRNALVDVIDQLNQWRSDSESPIPYIGQIGRNMSDRIAELEREAEHS